MRRILLLGAAALALVAGPRPGGAALDARPAGPSALLRVAAAVAPSAAPTAAATSATWHGGVVRAATGEPVTVYVSDSYPPERNPPQQWADFFAGLVHGSELGTATIRIAPLTEVSELCGPSALGCYGGRELVVVGDPVGGVRPEDVARHEYGHHVAASRLNAPWNALRWGTKRWATAAGVCARAAAGTAFPGDQGARYRLNPGEAFAEAYRVLNEQKTGSTSFSWDVVDASFYPDGAALRALEADVVKPWTRPTVTRVRARLGAGQPRTWWLRLDVPLDGEVAVTLTVPRGRLDDVELVTVDGRKVLARGPWTGTSQRRVSYVACGQRRLVVRVTRSGPPGPVDLVVSRP
jgi:hypothetical protein